MNISNLIEFMRGKKTYFIGGAGFAVIVSYMFGFVDYETMVTILNTLGFGGLVTLRLAIENK